MKNQALQGKISVTLKTLQQKLFKLKHTKKKKMNKNEQRFKDPWENITRCNIHIMGIIKGEVETFLKK